MATRTGRGAQRAPGDGGPDGGTANGSRDLKVAWWSLALVPAGFLVATLVGEGLLSLLGYDVATDRVPARIVAVAGLPALALLLAAPAAAVGYGRRALRAGNRAGRTPMVIGAALAVALVAINVASYVWG